MTVESKVSVLVVTKAVMTVFSSVSKKAGATATVRAVRMAATSEVVKDLCLVSRKDSLKVRSWTQC